MKKSLTILICAIMCVTLLVSCNSLKHEHINGEWEYNETHHWQGITCTWNKCDFDMQPAEHIDEDENDICDACGYDMSKLPAPINHFLRNQLGCEWLNETKVDDIAEIKIITESVGVAPGAFKNISSSVDKTVISKIYEDCYWLDTIPISKEECQIDGGGATTIKFILNNETIKEIYINNGNYKDGNEDYYKLLYTPKFSENDEYESNYGFVTYQDKVEVYWNDTFICEIPMSEIEFVEVDSYITTEGGIVGEWALKTEFGDLYFPESHIFHFVDNSNTIYKLTGVRLFKLVEKYSNWWVSQNGQPVLLD